MNVTLFMTFLVLVALVLVFCSMFDSTFQDNLTATYLADAIALIFIIETTSRMFCMGPKTYIRDIFCCIDLLCCCIDIAIFTASYLSSSPTAIRLVRFLRLLRLARLSRISRLMTALDETLHGDRAPNIEYDEHGHMFMYNSAHLFSTGWLVNAKGTVLAMPEIWVQVLMSCIIATIVAAYSCPLDCDYTFTFGVISAFKNDHCQKCVAEVNPSVGLLFSDLSAFLLGLFSASVFNRWWSTRIVVEDIMKEIRHVAMCVTSFIRGSGDRECRERKNLVRWAILGLYLMEKRMDGTDDYRDGLEKKFLTEDEWDALEKVPEDIRYQTPWQWAISATCALIDNHEISSHGGIEGLIENYSNMALTGDSLMTLKTTPVPYIFLHIVTLICKIHFIVIAIMMGSHIGRSILMDQWTQVILYYLVVVMSNILIEGLLRIHLVMKDPFGDDVCDFPWEDMFQDLVNETKMLLDQHDDLPHRDKNSHKTGMPRFKNRVEPR